MAWGPRFKVKKGESKYKNVKVEIDGHKFASKREAKRYQELKLLLSAGTISQLELQPRFPMVHEGVKICSYIADFQYIREEKLIIEDIKGWATDIFKLKAKMFKAFYPHLELTILK